MREAIFPLGLCLVAWFAFDLLEGQRDTARSERDSALFEVEGLREAARIAGERLVGHGQRRMGRHRQHL